MKKYTSEKFTCKKARILGNLTKRTSEPHERSINSKKRLHCNLFLIRM